jgi:SpoVK/Ycf46/Vps4 family AAA+-type ATPase
VGAAAAGAAPKPCRPPPRRGRASHRAVAAESRAADLEAEADRIDEAALRRFSFKLRFLPLTPAQRLRMFATEALGWTAPADLAPGDALDAAAADAVPAVLADRLAKLELLAPGDFAVVKRQAALLGEDPEPEAFVEQLEREHRAKPDVKFSKPMGFVR